MGGPPDGNIQVPVLGGRVSVARGGPPPLHALGPPPDTDGRRDGDLPPEVGTATTPNMSQDDIDTLLQPQKASL